MPFPHPLRRALARRRARHQFVDAVHAWVDHLDQSRPCPNPDCVGHRNRIRDIADRHRAATRRPRLRPTATPGR